MKSGESLELQVKQFLEEEIRSGSFGLHPNCAKVFHKKAYYSKDRKKEITFDVVIEVTRSGGSKPWLVWI